MALDFGYYFHPPLDDRVPGHPALEIRIVDVPTERHFDPQRVTLPVVGLDGTPGSVTVGHPWHGPGRLRVCVGLITMQDRKRKTVEAYSFGATAAIAPGEEFSHCVLSSAAPIFELVPTFEPDPDGIVTWLAAAVEALLARRRAAWVRSPDEFARRLGAADPEALYVAAMRAVRDGIRRRSPERRTEQERYAARMIDRALEAALERPSTLGPLPPLEEML